MTRGSFLPLLTITLLLGDVPAHSQGQNSRELNAAITQIRIQGNVNIKAEDIRAVTSEKIGDLYDQVAAEKDRSAIKGMGDFNGEIGMDTTPDPAGGVDVTFTVGENPVIKIIVFTANTADGRPSVPAAALLGQMGTKSGENLNTNTLTGDLKHLFDPTTGYMRQLGYRAVVSTDINIDPNSGVLSIPLLETHIRSIQIQGGTNAHAAAIQQAIHTKPGDIFEVNRLAADTDRIFQLNIVPDIIEDVVNFLTRTRLWLTSSSRFRRRAIG